MPKDDYSIMQEALQKDKGINKEKYQGLPLSRTDKEILLDRVLKDVDSDTRARQPFLDKVTEVLDLYEGKSQGSTVYDGDFRASSRVVTMSVETLHSILFPTVWNEDLQYWAPVGKEDMGTSEAVNKFMEWDSRYTKMVRFVDDWTKRITQEGTVVTKTRWVCDYKWVQKKTPKAGSVAKKVLKAVKNALTGKQMDFELTDQDYDISYEPEKIEYCDVDMIPLEDVGFPAFNSNRISVDKLGHIWHRTRPYIYELEDKESMGLIEDGSTSKVSEGIEQALIEKLEATTRQRMDAEGSRQMSIEKDTTTVQVIEWYGKYCLKGRWEDIVVWIEERSKTFLAATYLRKINKYCKRPFQIAPFIPRPGRLYGIGAGEIVKEYQKILDEMMSININAAKMGVNPPGFYRAASGFDPEKITLQPGIMVPVDDVNDVKWVSIPNNILPTSQEMKFIMEMVQQISGVGAYQNGQESSVNRSRSTARGTLALISQGERRFTVLGKRLQYHLAEVMKSKLEYYQQFLPPAFAERIIGQDGAALFPNGLSTDDLAGEHDLYMTLDSTGGSKSLKVEQASEMYSGYIDNPIVNQDPARLWELSARPLVEAGEINVERYLGPKPPTLEEKAAQSGVSSQDYLLQQYAQNAQLQAGVQASATPSDQASSLDSGASPAAPSDETQSEEISQGPDIGAGA